VRRSTAYRSGVRSSLRAALVVVAAVALTACATLQLPGAGREWRIAVENDSDQPALLFVAEDEQPMGALVGTAEPASVPPGTTEEVTFLVPTTTEGWAIFVNPNAARGLGPIILAADVPAGVAGNLPLTIFVAGNGDPSISVPNQPGWFGQ
jgi:hypothetical protein